MNEAVRIVQITDCHLPGDPDREYRGINSHQNLKRMLQKAKEFAPDLLLATGDLSEDGSPASYKAIHSYFEALGIPVLALPGNHDAPALLASTFSSSPVDELAVSEHGAWQIVRLNSCVENRVEGRIGVKILAELEQVLSQDKCRPRLVALHHQPISVDTPWIDKYRLFEADEFLQLIDQCEGVKAVVWGHVHQVYACQRDGVAMLGGPSTAINSLTGVQKFTTDNKGPACRWLELEADGSIRTGIISA